VPNLGPYRKTTTMKSLKAGLPVLAAALVLALPNAALAGSVIPPGNPAAIQYTEAFPSSHGATDAEHSKGHKRPDQTLGGRNAKRLESQGKEGREAARVAAETAPKSIGAEATDGSSGSAAGSAPNGEDDGSGTGVSQKGGGAEGGAPPNVSAAGDGGSGLGKVAGQATGLDTSEGTGLLLPLVVLAILAWGSAYVLRRRKRAAR